MGPFPILNFSVWVESPAEWDMSRGHQIMSELPTQSLKHICAEVAACAVLWPHASSDFCWRHNQARLLPKRGIFTLLIYKYLQVASWQTQKADLHCQIYTFPSSTWCRVRAAKSNPSFLPTKSWNTKLLKLKPGNCDVTSSSALI